MITVISATNRPDSMTMRVAGHYHRLISAYQPGCRLLSLQDHAVWERGSAMITLENEYLIPADKMVFVMPEYNGSFPGILKLMIDNSDIRRCWWYKKIMLVGLADGRAGNLRGLDQMTNILHYLKVSVLCDKLPLSRVGEEFSPEGAVLKKETGEAISRQITAFINF